MSEDNNELERILRPPAYHPGATSGLEMTLALWESREASRCRYVAEWDSWLVRGWGAWQLIGRHHDQIDIFSQVIFQRVRDAMWKRKWEYRLTGGEGLARALVRCEGKVIGRSQCNDAMAEQALIAAYVDALEFIQITPEEREAAGPLTAHHDARVLPNWRNPATRKHGET